MIYIYIKLITDNEQNNLNATNFSNIFLIKLQFRKNYPEVNSCAILIKKN